MKCYDFDWQINELMIYCRSTQLRDAEELRRYKELLDMGAITQEEFDAKKKELLNL